MSGFEIVGDDLVMGEYVGDDELAGEFDIVGARRRPSKARLSYASGRPVARRQTNEGAEMRRLIMPIPTSGSVAAAGTATVSAQPQKYIRIERLFVPAGFAGLLITDLKVGQESLFVAPGEIDCSLFVADSVGIQLKGLTAGPGILVTLSLLNTTAGALTLRGAAIVGYSVD